MFSLRNVAAVVLLSLAGVTVAQAQNTSNYPGVGRAASPMEIAAWDIDVRPDFKGLPPGSGSVAKGQDVWEAKCASCHGVFGESNEVFSPLVGGTTANDVKTGRVARLLDPAYPGRTTLMKVATVSTLWDFINRAMPWTQPKSLSVEEVYSVTAFMLNLGGVVPDDFTLSDKNMAQVQSRMPNRNGMTTRHALWPGKELGGLPTPDTRNTLCRKNCSGEPKLASFLPEFARNAHGNLAEQNHMVGQQLGADTSQPEVKDKTVGATKALATPSAVPLAAAAKPVATASADNSDNQAAIGLTQKHGCIACHSIDQKIIGPAFADIGRKYPGKADYLAGKIKSGGSGIWGAVPMPAQGLDEADAKTIAGWLAAGAGK